MGMFESFQEMKAEIKVENYKRRLKNNISAEDSDLSKKLKAAFTSIPNNEVHKN